MTLSRDRSRVDRSQKGPVAPLRKVIGTAYRCKKCLRGQPTNAEIEARDAARRKFEREKEAQEKARAEALAERIAALPEDYRRLSDILSGTRVVITEDATMASGYVIRAGCTGTIRWVVPGAERNCYLVKIDGSDEDTIYERGLHGFNLNQFVRDRGKLA